MRGLSSIPRGARRRGSSSLPPCSLAARPRPSALLAPRSSRSTSPKLSGRSCGLLGPSSPR
eukprot:8757905-Pyramimonas_sp.AAC.1